MQFTRRELIRTFGVAGALGAFGGLPGLLRAADRERIVVWRNWSGGQSCIPADRRRKAPSCPWRR